MLQRYQVDAKDIKRPFEWWGNHESLFPIIVFLACQILGLVGSQIEKERIFSLVVGILKILKRCRI
jgi:hypothetical protein